MAVNVEPLIVSPTNVGSGGRNNFTQVLTDFHEPLSWVPIKTSATNVRIIFGRELRKLTVTEVSAHYTITGPSVITITSAAIGVGASSFVDLTVTGTFATGTYTVTIDASTAQAQADDSYNTTTPITFSVSVGAGSSGASRTFFNTGFN